MKLALSILIIALCASAQDMMPPKFIAPAAAPVKQHVSVPIVINWTASLTPGVKSYNAYWGTNGLVFFETNVTGTSAIMQALGGVTNVYEVRSMGSNGIASAMSIPFTHSGWATERKIALNVVTNGATWTNIICADLDSQPTSFFRSGANAVNMILQSAPSLAFINPATLFTSDVSNFPENAEYRAVVLTSILNLP
jgi:hypothetical protein